VKAVILAGGLGSRLSEETDVRPKPMVEIGGRPMLWHIMKHFAHHGIDEFVVALGYKGEVIKRHFVDVIGVDGSLSVFLKERRVERPDPSTEDWVVHLVETGVETITGGRLKRLRAWLEDETFMMTYGDGVCDVDLGRLVAFHRAHGRLATVTVVRPPARFGALQIDGDQVLRFSEKPQTGEGWINGGFFVLEPGVFDYIEGDQTHWEREPLERLAEDGQLMAYRHESFWLCMDTLRDKRALDALWASGHAPWKVWP
jgi:glucose-1-phosphate cytidylyltransferase